MSVALAPDPVHAQLQRLADDFEFFARNCLFIRTKSGDVIPFKLNRAQQFLHEKLQNQLARKHKVRALIVKGRQLGISTYLQGRYYWLLWRSKKQALRAFILTHEDRATQNLFGMAQRFHDLMPAGLAPTTQAANAKELLFADTGCGYVVATAGTKEVGRSDTIQLLHGSEVPSWPNAENHIAGLFQALSKGPGSEGVLEATAKGIGNVFHRLAMASVRGESDYEAVFIPWFWGEDYETPCPAQWADAMPPAWHEYAVIHKLSFEQTYWAWLTNRELAQAKSLTTDEPCPDFRQEYPATFDEAFQSSGNSFIPALSVLRARQKRTGQDIILGRGPIILGVDPARSADNVGIIDRCGRVMGERICEAMPPDGDTVYLAQKIARIIDRIRPDAVNIDIGGNGAALYDILCDKGYRSVCNAVNFGQNPIGRGPTGDEMYANRRAEMYDLLRDWLETPGGVQIPDSDALHTDLTAAVWGPGATRYTDATNELVIEPKDKIKQRLGASPDLGDAAALTFAVPFAQGMQAQNQPPPKRRANARTGY